MTDTIRELAAIAADTLPVWRDLVVAILALVVIGCITLAALAYTDK